MMHCLILTIIMLVLMSANVWPNDFGNHQANIYTLSPSPQNYMIFYEYSLCKSTNIPINPPPHNNIRCPQKPIVTVEQLGRLGNQMYEYISVWAIAKKTGREPYVPSCMIQELRKIFQNLTVPALSYLAYCPVKKYPVSVTAEELHHSHESILLPDFAQLPPYIAPLVSEFERYFSSRNI